MQRIRSFEIIGLLIILSLTAVACISSVGASNTGRLEGVTWVLKSYGDPNNLIAAVADKEVTLTFDKDEGRVSGNGGINGYGGNYQVDGNKLTIKDMVQTMMAGPEPLMSQEVAFFNILQSAQSYKISGQELTITGTEGVLVFRQR